MSELLLITPVSRPDKLLATYRSICNSISHAVSPNYKFRVRWFVFFDFSCIDDIDKWEERFEEQEEYNRSINLEIDFVNNPQYRVNSYADIINHAFNHIALHCIVGDYEGTVDKRDWIYILEDGGELHPDFVQYIYHNERKLEDRAAVIFGQWSKNGVSRMLPAPDKIIQGFIEGGMMCFRLYVVIGGIRMNPESAIPDIDFIRSVIKIYGGNVMYTKKHLCYYNPENVLK